MTIRQQTLAVAQPRYTAFYASNNGIYHSAVVTSVDNGPAQPPWPA